MDHAVSDGFIVFPGGGGQVEAFHLGEEIHSLMSDAPAQENGSSFTALLGLHPTEALELLHHPDPGHSPLPPPTDGRTSGIAFGSLPTFPTLATAKAESLENSSDPSVSGEILNRLAKVKSEAVDSDPAFTFPTQDVRPAAENKRKESPVQKQKVLNCGKKTKSTPDSGEPEEKLPYVHVRTRRGQATDSHSLAERARREKINVRMKLLQELVPGCSKISGTALVLDEIINHVQSLQRQVEFLSMRLASVNPRIDFGLDGSFGGEFGALSSSPSPTSKTMEFGSVWPELQQANNLMAPRRPSPQQHPLWYLGACAPLPWARDDSCAFVSEPESTTPTSILGGGYDSVNSVPQVRGGQLKMEL